ncbi:MAG: hypothetical protein MI864_27225 [Pseudomonadales bacterium]|nr:hypothetical protein [Pseudomonadales bacterium]
MRFMFSSWLIIAATPLVLANDVGDTRPVSKLTFALLDGRESTLSSVILKDAYERLGIDVEFSIMPGERALYSSNRGLLDGEVNRIEGIDKNYRNLMRVPVEINRFEALAWSQFNIEINGWESLKPYPLLIKLGIKYAEQGTSGMNVRALPEYDRVFAALSNSPDTVAIASRLEGMYRIQKLGLSNIQALEPPLTHKALFHYLHVKHRSLLERVTQVLNKMRDSGALQAIRERHLANLGRGKNQK